MSFSTILWMAAAGSGLAGARQLSDPLRGLAAGMSSARREREELRGVGALLRELEETLGAGVVPEDGRWAALRKLEAPWGAIASESLQELRSCGGALLPTLRRLRLLAESHASALAEGQARASQALAQAGISVVLVPVLGMVLYGLLPGVDRHFWLWLLACGCALGFSLSGGVWMMRLAETARWGGLPPERRTWALAAQCAGERFLALVRAGHPADVAWTRSCEGLAREAPELAQEWGMQVWKSSSFDGVALSGASRVLADAGVSIRKSVQVSLMDGRPCTDRVEEVLRGLSSEMRAQVERELSLLGTRVLKPLFLCVAPALFGLFGIGMFLAFQEAGWGT